MKTQPKHPSDSLRELGESGGCPYDIASATALMMAALDHSERDLEPYRGHLQEIVEQAHHESRSAMNAEDDACALAELLAGRFGYDGDRKNADLILVIGRRRGMSDEDGGIRGLRIALSGTFLLCVVLRGCERYMDPFNGGAALDRERLGAPPATRTVGTEDMQALQPVTDAVARRAYERCIWR